MTVYLILALLFAVAVAVFAVANTEPVTINFLFNQLQLSLALVIIGSAAAGAIAVGIVSMVRQIGLRLRVWDRESRSRRYEKEAAELKNENTELQERVRTLEDELTETEAYTAHLEELLKQRGHDIEALQSSRFEEDRAPLVPEEYSDSAAQEETRPEPGADPTQ